MTYWRLESFIWLAATQQASTGPQPETGLDSLNTVGPLIADYRETYLYYETAIWSWDSVSGALTVSWTNADGSVVTPPFSYSYSGRCFCEVLDFAKRRNS
jgi:hypothetical protein